MNNTHVNELFLEMRREIFSLILRISYLTLLDTKCPFQEPLVEYIRVELNKYNKNMTLEHFYEWEPFFLRKIYEIFTKFYNF